MNVIILAYVYVELGVILASLFCTCQINVLLSLQASARDCCKAICKAVIEGKNEWKMGKTKIFLKVQKY